MTSKAGYSEMTPRTMRLDSARAGAIIAESGRQIPTPIDTICLHGDTPEAVAIARAVRAGLEGAGVRVAGF